jgi:hypothetical protein
MLGSKYKVKNLIYSENMLNCPKKKTALVNIKNGSQSMKAWVAKIPKQTTQTCGKCKGGKK